ncbi:hypothetical protein Ancab_022860, partial [Ancistrocladus abbreviatus]
MNNLFLGINALAYNVQQEPPTNDEVVLGNFEFLRTSRAKEFRKDNEEELFNSDVEVDDQRFKGHSHSANPDHPSQEWATSADFLGLSPEAQFQPNYSREGAKGGDGNNKGCNLSGELVRDSQFQNRNR